MATGLCRAWTAERDQVLPAQQVWDRPTAKQVVADLQAIMQQQGWSDSLLDTSGQPSKLITPL